MEQTVRNCEGEEWYRLQKALIGSGWTAQRRSASAACRMRKNKKPASRLEAFRQELSSSMPSLHRPLPRLVEAKPTKVMKASDLDPVARNYITPTPTVEASMSGRFCTTRARQRIDRYGGGSKKNDNKLPKIAPNWSVSLLEETDQSLTASTEEETFPEELSEVRHWIEVYNEGAEEVKRQSLIRRNKVERDKRLAQEQTKAHFDAISNPEPEEPMRKWLPPKKWDQSMTRGSHCMKCFQPVTWAKLTDVGCAYCSAVTHADCLEPGELRVNRKREWTCPECWEEIELSRQAYVDEKERRREVSIKTVAIDRIIARWRAKIQQRRFKTLIFALVSLQALCRTTKKRTLFKRIRGFTKRPVVIEVFRATNLIISDWDNQLSDPYVYITCLDEKYRQIWQMTTKVCPDTLNPEFEDERFVVPGLHAKCKIVFTMIDKDDIRDQFLGQAIIDLAEIGIMEYLSGEKRTYRLPLHLREFSPISSSKVPLNLDYCAKEVTGHIEVSMQPIISLNAMCGHLLGPSLTASNARALASGESSSATKPSKKLWLMLHEGKLYVHKNFGEMAAKVIIPLDKAKITMKDRGGKDFEMNVTFKGNTYAFAGLLAEENHRWRGALQLTISRSKMTQKTMETMFCERAWVAQRTKVWLGRHLQGDYNEKAKLSRATRKEK